MADAAIEVEKLTKDYPYGFLQLKKKRSLDALTMQVQTGEVFGFLGPNGAGKSTTIKLLMRLIFPTAGTARMLGKPISDIAMHRDIGYLPEQPYFYDYLTATELLDYFARFHDFPANDRRERVARTLKKVGLADSARVQLRKFSKGMLQRVGLAQAILHDPELVVLDEPMSGLDPVGRREVRDIILELKKQGKTVLFSTHILSDAEMLCDRVGVIAGGKLQGVGAPSACKFCLSCPARQKARPKAGAETPWWRRQRARATATGCRWRRTGCTRRSRNCGRPTQKYCR